MCRGVPDYFQFIFIFLNVYHHLHHHVVPRARISLTLSHHFPQSFIASNRSSGLHPVSSQNCWMYVRAGRPAFARPYVGVHRSTSLISSSVHDDDDRKLHLFDSIHRGKIEKMLLVYGLPKETVTAMIMLYKIPKVKVRSPDRKTDFF